MANAPFIARGGLNFGANIAQTFKRAALAFQAGNLAQATSCCRLVLAARKDQFDALHLLGVIELQQGRPAEALHLLKKALKANPRAPTVHLNYALAINALKGPAAALPSIEKALSLAPNDALALNNHGHALWRLGRNEEALASLDKAIAIAPSYADAFCNRGNVLCALKRFADAVISFDRALATNPKDAMAWHNRGNALWELKKPDEALFSYDRSLALNPHDVLVLMDRARMLFKLERYEEALPALDEVLRLSPDFQAALNVRGNTLWRLKRLDEAIASYDRFMAIAPDDPELLMNRANALGEAGRFDEALAGFDRSIALKPGYPEAHWNRGLLRLRLGDFHGGWSDYEWRGRKDDSQGRERAFRQPRWHGAEPLTGKTILVHPEQGLGDTIQFARFAAPLAERGARVIVQVQESLKDLLSELPGASDVIGPAQEPPPFDCHCPLLSLPFELDTRLETIPNSIPYVTATPERVAKWKARLPDNGLKRIGVAWAGSPTFVDDHNRSIGLPRFAPLLSVPGLQFFSIQKVLRPGDQDILAAHPSVTHLGDDIEDFGDTAAIMASMDLIVSSDTSVVHLAGAMGRPVWILLQHAADWRWLIDIETSPWYPSARLLRQPRLGDWESLVRRATDELGRFAQRS